MPKITDTLEQLLEENQDKEKVSLGDVIESFESRGFGPLLLIPALIAILPTGAVPGVPSTCGIFIILISSQLLFGRDHPWVPGWLRDLSLKRSKLKESIEKIRPLSERLDYALKQRLVFLTQGNAVKGVAVMATILAVLMIPLEAIPLAVFVPGSAILLFAIGLLARDGLLIVLGYALSIGAVVLLGMNL